MKPLIVSGHVPLSAANAESLRLYGTVELETVDRPTGYEAGAVLVVNSLRFFVAQRVPVPNAPGRVALRLVRDTRNRKMRRAA